MDHYFETKVYYCDTDAYGVVWHGHYLRWLEKGRIDFCQDLGFDLVKLQSQDIVLPVVDINIKYKASAKLNEDVLVKTSIDEITPLYIIFNQEVFDKFSKKIFVQAKLKVVAVNNQGKLYRRIPKELYETLKKVSGVSNEIE